MPVNDAILLAAGNGSRLRPFTDAVPKPLLTVGERSVLEHNLNALRLAGMRRVFVNTHAHSELIENYLGSRDWGMDVASRRESRLTGPAGGAALFRDDLDGAAALVVSADAVHAIDLAALVASHQSRGALLTVAVRPAPDPHRFGIPEIDEDNRITAFVEKPLACGAGERSVSCGIYCVDRSVLETVDRTDIVDFGRHIIPQLANAGKKVFAFPTADYWLDMGTPQALWRANLDAALGIFESRPTGRASAHGWLAATARVHPSAYLKGPLIIGDRALVEAGAVIEGPAVIGDGCLVARASHLREAVMLPGSATKPGARLFGAIIANCAE